MSGAKALFNGILKQRDASLNQFWDLLLVYSDLLKEIRQGDLEGLCVDGLEAVGVVVLLSLMVGGKMTVTVPSCTRELGEMLQSPPVKPGGAASWAVSIVKKRSKEMSGPG